MTAVKCCLADVLYYSGLMKLISRKVLAGKGVRILAYHRISDESFVLPGISMPVCSFDRQMRYISRYCTPLSLETAAALLRKREMLPANATVITFDDGYKDNYTNAYPLLKKYGIPATIFLSVKAIEEKGVLWFDQLAEAFRLTGERFFAPGIGVPPFPLGNGNERLSAAQYAVENGKKYAPRERTRYIARVLGQLGFAAGAVRPECRMLDWEDVIAMDGDGISFGSHGMTHTILANLSLPELAYEIVCSKDMIRARTGITVTSFAYPNGSSVDFTAESERLLSRSGYTIGCTLVKGMNDCTVGRYSLRRGCVTEGMAAGIFGEFSESLFAVSLSGLLGK